MVSERVLQFKEALFNRQNELEILHDAYESCSTRRGDSSKERSGCQDNDEAVLSSQEVEEGVSSSAVFLSGGSGSGKSRLVCEFEKQLREQYNESFYFLDGICNELDRGGSLSAFTEAMEGFFRRFLRWEEARQRSMSQAIDAALELDEKVLMTTKIPSLSKLLSTDSDRVHSANTAQNNSQSYLIRLLGCFKKVVAAICSQERPVILFVDDLHWADNASIQLMKHLLLNDPVSNFMFVGAYRSDEVGSDHVLSETLSNIDHFSIDKSNLFVRLELQNLSVDELTDFFVDTLGTYLEETKPLASFVWEKTEGNLVFSKQVLEELYREQLLRIEGPRLQWTIEEIDLDGIAPDGIRQAVTPNIKSLPKKHQMALAFAAFLKFKFDMETLLVVMKVVGTPVSLEELSRILELAVFRGLLLNSTGSNAYEFADNRIKDAAFALLMHDEDTYNFTRLLIAKTLLQRGQSADGKDWMLFVAVDHLNAITNHNLTPYDLAMLNLSTGEKAVAVAEFGSALRYLNNGIKFMSSLDLLWHTTYETSVRLYQAAADMEFCVGNLERGTQLCHTIIRYAKSEEEKLFPYYSIADSLGRQGRHSESLDVHLKALYLVGAFPRHFQTLFSSFGIGKVTRLLNATSDYDFLMLPRMTDKYKLATMEHLHFAMVRAYNCNKIPVVLMAIQKSISLSLEHGISLHTARAISSFGSLLFGVLKNYSLGLRLAKLSRDIVLASEAPETPKEKAALCDVLTCNTLYIYLYSKPVTECMETLREAEKFGFESGGFESAFKASCMINVTAYLLGLSLHSIKISGAKLMNELGLQKVDSIHITFNEYMMLIDQMTKLGPLRIDWANFHQELVPCGKGDALLVNVWCYWTRLQISYYFRRYDTAERISKRFEVQGGFENSFAIATIRSFFAGLTYAALARKTKQKQYVALAKKTLDESRAIAKKKGIINAHRNEILEADILSCSSSAELSSVVFAFDKAIESSKNAGVLQDTALANELAGEFCLSRKNKFRATMYLSTAHRLYCEWGADGKARYLKQLHGDYIQTIAAPQSTVRSSLEASDHAVVSCNRSGKNEASHTMSTHSMLEDTFSVSGISNLTSPSINEFRPKAKVEIPPPSETCSISEDCSIGIDSF